ncbi:thermonuclease family protein [Bartonella choladocola]|nr:thermonuclease family protein [Bartonella choladocola]
MKKVITFFLFLLSISTAFSQTNISDEFDVPSNVIILTGHSWNQGGVIVRLYGVEACHDSSFGLALDSNCSEAAKVFLAALITNGHPKCRGIYQSSATSSYLTICSITLNGNTTDMGMSMIVSGYAKSALDHKNQPINIEYGEAEKLARLEKSGLWGYVKKP